MRRLTPLIAVLAFLRLGDCTRAQQENVVVLPPFIVEEETKGQPWRYAQMPGFEILARCSDRTTRDLAEAHYRLHHLLELLLPERLQLAFAIPRVLIFYDEDLQSAASREVIASMLQRAEKAAPPVELLRVEPGQFALRGPYVPSLTARRINFLPNLRLWDKDAMSVFALVREGAFDTDRLMLTRDYVSYLLLNRAPELPWWFVGGVLGLYDQVEYDTGSLTLDPIVWISEKQTDALKRDPKTAPAPVPLAEFFTRVPPHSTPEEEARRQVWISQCALLVRWALDGRTPEQREAFWDFVDQAASGVTPAAFERCFGIDFATADAQLAAYLPTAVRKSITLRPAHPVKAPTITLRNASEAEIARIKGDWERLEVGFVRSRMPAYADKYLEQARRTLHHGYDSDAHNPRLLAVLGLCESDAGDEADARKFLEAAAQLGPLRPRAAYELARLRFAEAEAAPAGADGRLSVAQINKILTPVFAVREQAPALPEIYDLIAQVWERSAYQPTQLHLGVLYEGVCIFPRRSQLVYRTAALYTDRGYAAEAAKLIRLGLMVATDDAEHERFTQLQTKLAASQPPADHVP